MITQSNILKGPLYQVWVTVNDQEERFLFMYDPNEMSFNPTDFIGLTVDAALHLKLVRDPKLSV